jgi:hypothetical protein
LDGAEVTETFALVDEMMAWIGRNRDSLIARGLAVAVDPPRAGRSKKGVSLSIDAQHLISQLIVWDTGEAQLMLADALSGVDSDEHRQIDSRADLDEALADLLAWTAPGTSG